MDLRARLRLEYPIFQVGMAGGLTSPALVSAVSRAGALGTLGTVPAPLLATQIQQVRSLAPSRPLAVNILVPFHLRAHIDACIAGRVDAVVLFYGFAPEAVRALRDAGIFVVHQVGTMAEALHAVRDGADALIVQGIEAGGHLLGRRAALDALRQVLAVVDKLPVLVAGGISGPGSVREAMAAGAAGVACGSRFLLTEECQAHPLYKQRVLGATRTMETELFGFGWPARHRVVPNAATERWCARDPRGPAAVRALNARTSPIGRVGMRALNRGPIPAAQRLSIPLYSPAAARTGDPDRLIEVTPLYAGESVREMHAIVPAEQAVRELADGLR